MMTHPTQVMTQCPGTLGFSRPTAVDKVVGMPLEAGLVSILRQTSGTRTL